MEEVVGTLLRPSFVFVVLVLAGTIGGCVQVWEQVQATISPSTASAQPQASAPAAPVISQVQTDVGQADVNQVEIAALPDLNDFEMASGAATGLHPAVSQIEAFGEEVLFILENDNLSEQQQDELFCDLLARDLDVKLIGRFVLGRHWKDIDEPGRPTYLAIFKKFLVRTYSSRLGGIRIDDFDALEARSIGKKDILVRSLVDHGTRKPVRADWRMRESDGRYLILDLSVEGISMAVVLKQEFASVLRKMGFDGLMAMLRDRTA
jgi:phospholipid transport system substrate-binding protein